MSNYQVNLLIVSKKDRNHFNFLKLDHRKFYPIAVIDEYLKHIEEEVEKNYKSDVNLRFKLAETMEVEGVKKKEIIELGEFEFVIKPTTKFLNEDRFYQIAETEIHLNSPNVNGEYKKTVLENIRNAKIIKKQNTSDKKSQQKKKSNMLGKLFTNKKEQSFNEGVNNIPLEEPKELHEVENTETETVESIENNEPETKQVYNGSFDESVLEDKHSTDDTNKVEASNDIPENKVSVKENEIESLEESESVQFSKVIDIPDFQLPKVKSKDVFLTQHDDPLENKRLSYLFDRETRLASHKEKRLVEIYNALVDKYHQYVIANDEEIEDKLKEYEKSRDAFVEEFTKEIKEQAKIKLQNKKIVLDEKQNIELEDFKEEQKNALNRFEEQLKIDEEEILSAYKETLQNEVKEVKHKAGIRFEENKEKLKRDLKQKVERDVYNYVMLDKKEHVQALNDEVFKYDEETYKHLDKKLKEWQADLDNKKQKLHTLQQDELKQVKHEAEKEKAQAEILAMKEKDREIETNNQRIKEQELEQKRQEIAFNQEEQKLKAREIDAKEKANELAKAQAENTAPNRRKLTSIITFSVIALLILLLLAFQFIFKAEPTYAELVDNNQYADAYEQYPNRYNDILNIAYEENDLETLEYLSNQNEDDQISPLYLALSVDNTDEVIQTYETIENKNALNDDILKAVADKYLLKQDIDGAKEVNNHISNNEYSEKIAETQNYIEIKKDLERVIEESDDEKEVSKAERDLEQINTLLKVQEDTNNE